jgi:hypothetical protein
MRLPRRLVAFASVYVVALTVSAKASEFDLRWRSLLQPCNGDCAIYVFAGSSIATNVQDIFFKPIGPTAWQYSGGSIVGGAVERRIATVFNVIDIEGELGTAKRLGDQTEGEFWGAFYVRYTAFPWNNFIYTTLGLSTGLSYATGISDFEKAHSDLNPPAGTHIQHYFSPELTFALPEHKERQLVLRLHHRSGAYGLVSGATSGSTYITVGVRAWF